MSPFLMVEATVLKLWHRGHLQLHDLPTEFDTNLPIASKVEGGQTDT
jgi:hypothetical protein